MSACTLYVTCKDLEEARKIGKAVVAERLAACANILPDMTSIYRWEGEIVEDQEVVLLLKTQEARVDALSDRVKALHSYDIPCIVRWEIVGGNAAYLDWISQETQDRKPH